MDSSMVADKNNVTQPDPQVDSPAPAGNVDNPPPRWVLYVGLAIYAVWLAFLGAMVWVRMSDPHYLGP